MCAMVHLCMQHCTILQLKKGPDLGQLLLCKWREHCSALHNGVPMEVAKGCCKSITCRFKLLPLGAAAPKAKAAGKVGPHSVIDPVHPDPM